MGKAFEKIAESRKLLVEQMIALMEEGYHKNRPLWNHAAVRPHNPESGAVYRGGNRLRLMIAAELAGYEDNRWMTFRQMQKAGYRLKPEQHGTLCEKWIFEEYRKQKNEKGEEKTVEVRLDKPKVSYFYVYNAKQIQDYPEEIKAQLPESPQELLQLADQLIVSSECPVHEDPVDRAFYNKSKDYICLPQRSYFKNMESFISVLSHEMGHSTGHETRLNRKFGTFFGDADYAKEELRAELGSAFLQADLGLEPKEEVMEDHSDYLKSWIGALRDDPNELFRACADADKISERLYGNYRKLLEKQVILEKDAGTEQKKAELSRGKEKHFKVGRL